VFEDNIGASKYQSEDMASIATRKVVIITGGNAGIGLETAKHLSKIGFHTIIGITESSLSHQIRM
jgi:NAD(P)-dependent dehydrogenase (short-subunit alcohol dehydrogenase family)